MTVELCDVSPRDGITTGVDLDALIETARWLARLLGRPVPGRVQQSGRWP